MAERRAPSLIRQPERFPGTAVIGAGVVGLSIAESLSRSGPVAVFEAERKPGTHTSARNSEVIHSGIYYPPGSEKARLCVVGRQMLYQYSEIHGVAHRRTGKLVVATTVNEIVKLAQIHERAQANGVDDIAWLSAAQVQEMEPAVRAVAALHSPSTGIIDSEGLMASLQRDARRNGAEIILASPVTRGEIQDDGIVLEVAGDLFKFDAVVNSAGFSAQTVARNIDGIPQDSIPETYYAKGHYYSLEGKPPFTHLVYPVPVPGGLGTHATIDLGGSVRFGPDVEWVDTPDYTISDDPRRKARFVTAIRQYYPDLDADKLHVVYTGIRPKTGRGAEQDFIIQGEEVHGIRGYVGLYGIESPGLTASLAIAGEVEQLLFH